MKKTIEKLRVELDKTFTIIETWMNGKLPKVIGSPIYDPLHIHEKRMKKELYPVGTLLKRKSDGKLFKIIKHRRQGLELEASDLKEFRNFVVRWSKIEEEYETYT